MTSEKIPDSSDINALASEVMDLWQEHLAAYANDPVAKAELIRLMEPQRRLFADWAAMMQNGEHGSNPFAASQGSAVRPGASAKTSGADAAPKSAAAKSAPGAASAAASPDDSALRVAQLTHRVAELEKRLAKLESGKPDGAKKTPRRTKPVKH
jgi:hypothetical protein